MELLLPSRPFFGRFGEARIERAKQNLLEVSLVRIVFSFEKLLTLVCQIENVLNSKPTRLVSAHPNLPSRRVSPNAICAQIQRPRLSLLDSLEERKGKSKWNNDSLILKVGDVTAMEENTAPLQWYIARITHVYTMVQILLFV